MVDTGKKLMREGIQGVVELSERERCKDAWWNEVTDELRAGRLSENNWRYLHGYEVSGCQLSREERDSRRSVIYGASDPRLQEPKFQEAIAIVANNDSKYQINKDRAKKYARDAGAPLRWAVAKDIASSETLQAEPCHKDRKIKRLGMQSSVSLRHVCFFSGLEFVHAFAVCYYYVSLTVAKLALACDGAVKYTPNPYPLHTSIMISPEVVAIS